MVRSVNLKDTVRLESDFFDFYDIWFDGFGSHRFKRFTNSGMDRVQMFKYFDELGVPTPLHGTVAELESMGVENVVVYTDYNAHCGEGKMLLNMLDENKITGKYDNIFASEYIDKHFGESVRLLILGEYYFIIRYKSSDNWRSNWGTVVSTKVLEYGAFHHMDNDGCKIDIPTEVIKKVDYPIFAIDCVYDGESFKAIDFNIAPGAMGIGIETLISPMELAESIKYRVIKLDKGER